MMIATQVSKHHYLYPILDKDTSFYHSHNENSNHYQHYHSQPSSSSPPHQLQNQESNTAAVERTWKDPFIKRILVVDDDPDITLTFKVGLEDDKSFEVYTYTDPLEALSRFRPHFYDLLLVDINMPKMNGFELCTMILKIDVNVRICFITAGDTNIEALREIYPTLSIGCFIKKPVTIEYLAKRLKAELD
ncbi:MAG: response regulator transcription factor [Nitrososphaeraceae archaeon]|jgi:CheY-like chemotaxis protein